MSTSDRVCPTHGDIGALPTHNNCPQCGAQLEMKGILRSSAESIIPAAAIGLGLGAGMEAGKELVQGLAGGITDGTDYVPDVTDFF